MGNSARGIPHSAPSISLPSHIFLVLKLEESRMIHGVQEHTTSHLAALPSAIKHHPVGLALDPFRSHEVALAVLLEYRIPSTRNSYISVKLRISSVHLCPVLHDVEQIQHETEHGNITPCIKLFPCSALWCFSITSILSFHFPSKCSHTGPLPKNLTPSVAGV